MAGKDGIRANVIIEARLGYISTTKAISCHRSLNIIPSGVTLAKRSCRSRMAVDHKFVVEAGVAVVELAACDALLIVANDRQVLLIRVVEAKWLFVLIGPNLSKPICRRLCRVALLHIRRSRHGWNPYHLIEADGWSAAFVT